MKEVSRQKINEKLNLLHLHPNLPKKPTAGNGLCKLLPHMKKDVLKSNFSDNSLQKISDHIGFFLGLINKVKIKIGIESSEYMLSVPDQVDQADKVGLYKVLSSFHREIQLTKKFRFNLENILGILAHEYSHNYLYSYKIREDDEAENEILTDVAAVYLGLGSLLLKGYEPITWTSNHWRRGDEQGYTTHSFHIGYISIDNIRYAIRRAAVLRQEREFLRLIPVASRIWISCRLWRKEKRKNKKNKKLNIAEKKRRIQIEKLYQRLKKAKSAYDYMCEWIQKTPKEEIQMKVPSKLAPKLVEFANSVYTDDLGMKLEKLIRDITNIKHSKDKYDSELRQLSINAENVLRIISKWEKVLYKFIR